MHRSTVQVIRWNGVQYVCRLYSVDSTVESTRTDQLVRYSGAYKGMHRIRRPKSSADNFREQLLRIEFALSGDHL